MQSRLVRRSTLLRRMSALALITLAMLALVFALMRPQWGMSVQRAVRVDSQIMICLDVSKSMLAEDVAPNRLERAKIELDSLLGLMAEGQQVGLIAFAGKAAVLCPMTTDFGFLRMILNEAEPQSVGLGGTQIGDAIRKAVDGFRESGDIHRLILLVTDGEDHDSFPLEAAKAAKEKGVKIVSVGFGDEVGSKIEIADPQTGGRSFVKDRNGKDVVSRLDGETLRDIALQTDGAYIPAGTGALDLESIYRTHIASMLRGSTEDQQHIVRNEAYQWLVIAALVLLFMSWILATPWNLRTRALVTPDSTAITTASRAAAWCLAFGLAAAGGDLRAQPPAATPLPPQQPAVVPAAPSAKVPLPESDTTADDESTGNPEQTQLPEEEGLTPRAAYNRGVACVQADPEQAERYLNLARRDAGSDGELRYRSLYNLGWVEVARADTQLKDEPAQALQHLQQAANRFREAVRVRPDSPEARHNLEIVSQRILELTDALAKKDPRDLASRLEELIQQLRGHQTELQVIVQQAGDEVEKNLADTYRQEFRRLGVTQRQILADYQRLADDARKELDAINQKPDDKKSPEERMKAGQYTNVLRFLDSGLQRLNQSRSVTRRLQGNRAFRRWSAGLSDTKRARDQLRNPVELLGYLMADAAEMAQLTRQLASSSGTLSPQDQPDPAPTWLTREYLQDLQTSTLDRTTELEQALSSATAKPEPSQTQPSAATQPTAPDPQTQQLLDNIQRAIPSIQKAAELFEQSSQELPAGSLDLAYDKQMEAIVELSNAWEWFLDVRRLIEVIYRDAQVVRQATGNSQGDPQTLRQIAAAIAEAQKKNITRAHRLDRMLDFEMEQLAQAPPPSTPTPQATNAAPPAPDEQKKAERERLERAKPLLANALSKLVHAGQLLDEIATEPEPAPEPAEPVPAAQPAPEPEPEPKTVPESGSAASTAAENTSASGHSSHTHCRGAGQRRRVEPAGGCSARPDFAAQSSLDRSGKRHGRGPGVPGGTASIVLLLGRTLTRYGSKTSRSERPDGATEHRAAPAQTPEKLGPLGNRQTQLQQISQQIAAALKQQGEQAATAPPTQPTGTTTPSGADATAAAETAKTLSQAAELVDAAQTSMSAAAQKLASQAEKFDAASKPFDDITGQQRQALEKLAEALALLDKSQQPQNQQGSEDQNQNQQQESQNQESENQARQQQNLSANQLLQLIRDREAQRRDDKKQPMRASGSGVEKDW